MGTIFLREGQIEFEGVSESESFSLVLTPKEIYSIMQISIKWVMNFFLFHQFINLMSKSNSSSNNNNIHVVIT